MDEKPKDNLGTKKSPVKNKFTTYLTEEAENALTELYILKIVEE